MNTQSKIAAIQFVDEAEREYFLRAKLGIDVENFLFGDVGRYLHGRARAEYAQAQEDALKNDIDTFWGRRKLKKNQRKAEIAQAFMRWCADAIVDGRTAARELEK